MSDESQMMQPDSSDWGQVKKLTILPDLCCSDHKKKGKKVQFLASLASLGKKVNPLKPAPDAVLIWLCVNMTSVKLFEGQRSALQEPTLPNTPRTPHLPTEPTWKEPFLGTNKPRQADCLTFSDSLLTAYQHNSRRFIFFGFTQSKPSAGFDVCGSGLGFPWKPPLTFDGRMTVFEHLSGKG